MRTKRALRVLDVVGLVVWAYFLVDWFVLDIERPIVDAWPAAGLIFSLKFLWFLGIAILLSMRVGRWTWAIVGYLVAWPVVFVVWKVPAFFWRRRSTALALAAIQGTFQLLTDLRFKLIVMWLWLAAALTVALAPSSPMMLMAATGLVCLLVVSWVRGGVRMVRSPSFVAIQQQLITKVLSADRTKGLFALDAKYLERGIDRYEPNDAQMLMVRIGAAVALNKGLLVWASQLDHYRRRYRPNLIFALLALVGVYLSTLVTLSVVHLGIHKWDATQFRLDYGDGSYMQFLLYTFSAMAGNEGGGVHPTNDVAMAMALVAGLFGALILAYLLANGYLVFRHSRDEEATQDLVTELRARAAAHAQDFRRQYRVSVDDARKRLERLGFAFAAFLARLSALTPDDEPGDS